LEIIRNLENYSFQDLKVKIDFDLPGTKESDHYIENLIIVSHEGLVLGILKGTTQKFLENLIKYDVKGISFKIGKDFLYKGSKILQLLQLDKYCSDKQHLLCDFNHLGKCK
jgi:hypothetical protein